jgi:rhodanese-related sulfurtransferase
MLGYMAENILSGECDVVAPDELEAVLSSGWTLIDVRTPSEHASGSIPHSINLPLDALREDLPRFGKGPFVVYCEVGQRGHTATSLLHELGIEARNLDGGYRTWLAADAARAGETLRLATTAL